MYIKKPSNEEKIKIMNEHEGEKSHSMGLFVPNRHMSIMVAALLAVSFSLFMGGYFFGKKTAINELTTQIETDSFADHVYSSMCALYDKDQKNSTVDSEVLEEPEPIVASNDENQDELIQEECEILAGVTPAQADMVTIPELTADPQKDKKYYAQLIGFGKKNIADVYVQKMKKKGFDLVVQKKISKSAKGKTVAWYQVVTPEFGNRKVIEDLVDRISQEEKIKDARIISC